MNRVYYFDETSTNIAMSLEPALPGYVPSSCPVGSLHLWRLTSSRRVDVQVH